MRRYIPAFLLTLAVFAPLLTGCTYLINKLKGGGADAGGEASVAVVAVDAAAVPTAAVDTTDAAAVPTTTTTATTLPTAPTVKPVLTDAGKPVDAGATIVDAGVKTDGGPAPAPTPTLKFPSNFFDGGGLRFDAGGFKPPWQK
jgi:hypothetical protein